MKEAKRENDKGGEGEVLLWKADVRNMLFK